MVRFSLGDHFLTSVGSNSVQNATWIINHLKVYEKRVLNGEIGANGSSASLITPSVLVSMFSPSLLLVVAASLLL